MDAIESLKQALLKSPKDPALYYELGGRYLINKQFEQALASLQQALKLAPNHPQILMQLGNTASGMNNETQAKSYFLASLAQDAKQADVHFNLANSLRKLGELVDAVKHYQWAIQLNPGDADYFNNMGNALREAGQLPQAIKAYEGALAINPNMVHALVHWIHQKQHMADWSNLTPAITRVRQWVSEAKDSGMNPQVPPFAFTAMPDTTPQEQVMCATSWAESQYGHVQALPKHDHARKAGKYRIAYVSSDFRVHPLAYLVTDVLAAHDKTQFELYAYSHGKDDDSEERQAIKNAVDHWIDIQHMPDVQVAQHMREHDIVIAIDLSGYTQNSRSGIFAYRPARASINWLGFPGSMGTLHGKSLFDYIVVDDMVNVADLSEKTIHLPCYQSNNTHRPVGEAGTRASHNLPEDALVFCCFNQSFKITQPFFDCWLNLLKRVPNSVLWLIECNPWASDNLKTYAIKQGVAAERIIFAPRAPIQQHIARHQHADIGLDTLPYNAHTTSSDALYMGLPMVTCIGATFSARVTASLLKQCSLNELVAQDLQSYEEIAYALAMNAEKRAQLKSHLLEYRDCLFNPKQFAQQLEQAYLKLCTS